MDTGTEVRRRRFGGGTVGSAVTPAAPHRGPRPRRVGDADHLPQLDRHRDRVLQVPAALTRVGIERGRAGRPVSTRSRCQDSVNASRIPEHMPWPANGGIRWAASPANSTGPPASAPPSGRGTCRRCVARADLSWPMPDRRAGSQTNRDFRRAPRSRPEQHPLPPAAPRPPGDERRRPHRVAPLEVDPASSAGSLGTCRRSASRTRIPGPRAACPTARGRGCWRRRSRRHRRPRPPAPRRRDPLLAVASPRRSLSGRAVPLRARSRHLPALVDLDLRDRLGRAVEQLLELGLEEHRRPRPAGGAGFGAIDQQQRPSAAFCHS